METAVKKVARLRLQPVLPLCERAVNSFKEIYPQRNQLCIKMIDAAEDIHVWVDDDLFVDALVDILSDLYSCLNDQKSLTLYIGRTGSATFRLLATCAGDLNLSSCEGPISVSSCSENRLENVMNIIKMHGGSMQIWHRPANSDCILEINLICLSRIISPGF